MGENYTELLDYRQSRALTHPTDRAARRQGAASWPENSLGEIVECQLDDEGGS